MNPYHYPTTFPNDAETQFLRVLFSHADTLGASVTVWVKENDFDKTPITITRLIPLLYARIKNTPGIEERLHEQGLTLFLNKIRGIYKLAWYKHHINREQLREVLALLHDAAIPVVLLKGCALTSFLPPEYHVRFQSDSDLLIPTNTIHRTIEVFKKAAWSYTDHTQRTYEKAPVDTLVHRFKEVSFTKETWTNRGGGDIDIHWHCTTPDKHTYTRTALFTEHLWNSARPLAHTLEGGLVPELSDLIIHIIAHGAYRNSIRPIRWVSDIGSLILWGNQPINWSQVAQRAEQYGFTAELYFAVSYLHTHLTELIEQSSPTREYLRILSTPPSRAELREYFSKTETIIVPFLGNFPKLWNVFTDHYVLQHPKQQFPPWIHFTYWKGFIYYIAHEWNLPNPYSLPRFITQKMWGRFTNWAHRNKIFLSLKK